MSIDTLLEAARYLEWQAQQQQIAREEEQRKQKELLTREVELRRAEVVTLSAQAGGANHHIAWRNDSGHQQQAHHTPAAPPPPPPSLPPAQVPIAVIPVVPVVTATPSAAAHTATPIAVATNAMLVGSPTARNGSSPPHHHLQPPPPQQQTSDPRPLLASPQIKVEPAPPQQNGGNTGQSPLPQLQLPYQATFNSTTAAVVSQHALLPQHSPDAAQSRTNGLMVDDMRGLDGKRRPGGAGTREVHNKLEKNRRAHLKECFETLKKNVPNVDEKKTSNLSVLRGALRYIQTLKRKEKEYEHEMERLAREKISTQQRLAELKNELSLCMDVMEIDRVLRQTVQPEDDQASTSTASEGEEDLDQDIDEDMSSPSPVKTLPKPPPPILQAHPLLAPHLSIPLSGVLTTPPAVGGPAGQVQANAPQAIAPAPAPHHPIAPAPAPHHPIAPAPAPHHPLQPSAVQAQPTVIARAAVSHPSVIQAVNHKHLTHIAPSPRPASATPQPIAAAPAAHQPIGHITVHPVAHLGPPLPSHLPALYPQGVAVSQPTMVGHITHTFTHHALAPHVQANAHTNANGVQVKGATVVGQGPPSLGKPTAVLAPHPQLVGQTTVLNPVTMVTVPPFPVSTLKLA